jgi:hypothetical protein
MYLQVSLRACVCVYVCVCVCVSMVHVSDFMCACMITLIA